MVVLVVTLARNSRSVEHEIGKPQGRRRPKAIGPPRVWPLPLRCGGTRDRLPAFWAWHDHSAASRRVHGAAYATYIGCWRKHARVAQGQRSIARFEDAKTGSTRSFCSRCGTPLLYERQRSLHIVNIPRALFTGRTGREPRYHVAIEELQDWAYTGKRLVPLKGYPGIAWERPKSRKRTRGIDQPLAILRLGATY